jgi:hypothetical protein
MGLRPIQMDGDAAGQARRINELGPRFQRSSALPCGPPKVMKTRRAGHVESMMWTAFSTEWHCSPRSVR